MGDGIDVFPAGGGGGSGAPTTASYVTTAAEAGLSAEKVLGTDVIKVGTDAGKPAAAIAGLLYFANDSGILYRDTGAAWVAVNPLQGAGLSPNVTGGWGYDSTQRRFMANEGIATAPVSLAPSVQLGNGGATDLDDAASGADGTTEKTFATNFAIPANFLIANKVLLLTVHLQVTSSSTSPTWLFRVKLGSTNVYAGVAAAFANSLTTRGMSLEFQIQGTAAAGASVAVMVGGPVTITGGGWVNWANTVAQSVAGLATDGALTLQVSGQWGTATTGNTVRLHQFIVQELN